MNSQSTPKLCECGCGDPAPVATRNNAYWGMVRGQPRRFIYGHHAKTRRVEWSSALWDETDCGYVTPCFMWKGAKDPLGYGRVNRNGHARLAHRVSYEEIHGPVPEGLTLDHLCRIPSCVNPAHLEAVTLGENLRRGAGAKLSHEAAATIRRLHVPGTPFYDHELAAMFGVHPRTICEVLKGNRWTQEEETGSTGRGY